MLPSLGITPPPQDALRHALGTGFVLLLITGMALRLIPEFAGVLALAALWLALRPALRRPAS